MNEKQKQIAVEMLSQHANELGNNICNDWDFPDSWTHQERADFCKGYHAWNGNPEEFSEDCFYMSDFCVARYLAHLLSLELGCSDEPNTR